MTLKFFFHLGFRCVSKSRARTIPGEKILCFTGSTNPGCFITGMFHTCGHQHKKHGMLVQVTLPFLFWKRLKSLKNTKNSYQPLLASFGGRKSAEQRVFLKTKKIESLSLVDVGFPVAREAKPVDLYLEVGKSDNNHAMFYFAFGT